MRCIALHDMKPRIRNSEFPERVSETGPAAVSLAAPWLRLNHYRATPKSVTEGPLSRRIHLPRGPWREISFIVSPYLLTRVAYECKFASLRYRRRQREPNKFTSVARQRVRQLRRSPPPARNVKEETPMVRAFVLCPARLIYNVKTRARIFGLDMRFGPAQ